MDDRRRATRLQPQTKAAQGGVGAPHLGEGGPDGNPSGPRDAGDPGSSRYGSGKARGSNETKRHETKEGAAGWTPRQGGPQSAAQRSSGERGR